MVSKRFELVRMDVAKITKGTLLAAVGAALAAVASQLELIRLEDYPMWGPTIGAAIAVAVNAIRKFVGESR